MRLRTPDLLKGIAVIFMILIHIVKLYALPQITHSFVGHIVMFLGGPPAAPVFMAVMGYFLAFSNKGLKHDLYRGGQLIVWGYALNIGLNLHLFYYIYKGVYLLNPWEYVFGVDILFLAGLSVMIVGLLKHFFQNNVWIYVALLLVIIAIPEFISPPKTTGLSSYIWAYLYSDASWSYFPLVTWFSFVLVGYIFNLLQVKIMPIFYQYKWRIFGLSAIVLIFSLRFGVHISADLQQYYHHGVVFFGFVLVFFVFWVILMHEITGLMNNMFTRYIEWLGKNVTTVYVFQWLLIGNIATPIYQTQTALQLVFWFFFILILSSVGTDLWKKIKQKKNNTTNHFLKN